MNTSYQNDHESSGSSRWSPKAILDALDWEHARGQVAQENSARVAVAGLHGAGKSTLLNRLQGWEVSPVGANADVADDPAMPPPAAGYEDFGKFVLIDLPLDGHHELQAGSADPSVELAWTMLSQADLVLFVLDGALLVNSEEGQAGDKTVRSGHVAEYRWLCRLRSLGRPIVLVLNKMDLLGDQLPALQRDLEVRLAMAVIAVSARDDPDIAFHLLPRILDTKPDLLVPLAGEIPALRKQAAQRLIRQTTLLSAVTGLEPVPLLDLPLQLALQARMLLRLAAIYGQPRSGGGSHEMAVTFAGGLGLRFAVQQLAKLVPLFGWVVSAALSGLTTYLIGQAAVTYYQGQWRAQVERVRQLPGPVIETLAHNASGVTATARSLPRRLAVHRPRRSAKAKEAELIGEPASELVHSTPPDAMSVEVQ